MGLTTCRACRRLARALCACVLSYLCYCLALTSRYILRPAGMGKVHKNGPGTKGKFKEGQRVTAGGWCVTLWHCSCTFIDQAQTLISSLFHSFAVVLQD